MEKGKHTIVKDVMLKTEYHSRLGMDLLKHVTRRCKEPRVTTRKVTIQINHERQIRAFCRASPKAGIAVRTKVLSWNVLAESKLFVEALNHPRVVECFG
jgi:hypothetical protein